MTPEQWLPVPGWEDLYEVSDQGRVRSRDRLDNLNRRRKGRILAAPANSDGYRQLGLFRDGVRFRRKVQHLVAGAFIGPQAPGLVLRHLDGNPANNHVSNLAYGTPSDNMQDMLRHGTNPYAARTHCPYGHPYDEANTYFDRHGWRQCWTCRRRRDQKHTEKPPKHATAVMAVPRG